jgi:hypothetical protein
MTDIERCDKEIAQAEAMLRAGHRDVPGLLLQLMDWSIERRMLSDNVAVRISGANIGDRMEAWWA